MRFWKLLILTTIFGTLEDLIAVWVVTGRPLLDLRTIGIVLVIATLFAVVLQRLHHAGGLK